MNSRLSALVALACLPAAQAAPVPLFDGKSLAGWEVHPGEEKWWRVQDGLITGGSLDETLGSNSFLSTKRDYRNFELRFKVRIVKGEGFINSGVQVRSAREPGKPAMIGYQVDAGIGYWGDLYDEHRRNAKISGAVDPVALKAAVKDWDWNDYRILCEGRRIRSWINGVPALDYTERDSTIPLDGVIGIQAHAGGKFLVQYKDVTIDELPDTPGAPSWKPAPPAAPAPSATGVPARTAAEQLKSFRVPEGFVAELVASEEQGVGKPITVAWDAKGRMWTMTALEYPVDANENLATAEALYARDGKDKVLVFDDPSAPLPLKPRVFAEGLAIPLGLLPDLDGNGALVQHGNQIRRYVDTNGDGKADRFDVVLDGFGFQDSHLMPHQFERAPGGWIYVAQGLFNASKVRRPDGKPFPDGSLEKAFNACKLAKFRPDGSDFELLTAGPNNIWGLAQTRSGEVYIQEANDVGIPAVEFVSGTHYTTGSSEKLKPYAPQIPRSLTTGMGGTGLSGLTSAGDAGSKFASLYGGDEVLYVANPITNRIQVITTSRDGAGRHPEYYKRADFLVSDDPWFRPVSVRFGPDGFLYITDWYNKIISHNEVPRNHPDRDKTHGRIWRVRPVDAKPAKPVDLVAKDAAGLVKLLGGESQGNAAMAWQRLAEEKPAAQAKALVAIATDAKAPLARRLDALYALEASGLANASLFSNLFAGPSTEIRTQAVRAAGEVKLAPADFVKIFGKAAGDPDYRVRAALANAVRAHTQATPEMMELVARLGRAPLSGGFEWDVYDRQFERYLARWAMESHRKQTEDMLAAKPDLDPEARLLAILALEPARAAAMLVAELPSLSRPLDKDELSLLGGQLGQPAVLAGLETLLADPVKRKPLLDSLTRLDPQLLANPTLAAMVTKTCRAILGDGNNPNPADRELVLQLTRLLRLKELEPVIAGWLGTSQKPAEIAAILSALREIGSTRIEDFARLVDHADDSVRRAAVGALASAGDLKTVSLLAERWPRLPGALRSIAIDGMTSSKAKAEAFAKEAAAGKFQGLDGGAYERLILVLGERDPSVVELLSKTEGLLTRVIRLPDGKGKLDTPVDLDGPFTVETWIKLDPGIDNRDGLLGVKGGPDFNFYDGRLRVFGGRPAGGDVIVANRKVQPDTWVHCAVTRDDAGKLRIYLDGESDQDKGGTLTGPLKGLFPGQTDAGTVAAARFLEFRVWNVARTPDEIRENYRTNLAGAPPAHLVLRLSGDQPGKLQAPAAVELTRDFPQLITAGQAAAASAKFAKYRATASQPGDPVAGRALFQATCMICHQVKGEGMQIGPDLSGAGAMGLEAVLRNVLDPNAQLESGYYRHDVTLADGTLVSGFLVQETKDSLTIRPIGAEPRVIERSKIASHDISKRSLMPEGLIDGFNDKQVADLFSYLISLK